MRWGLGGDLPGNKTYKEVFGAISFTSATEKTRGLAMFECYSPVVPRDFVIDSWTGWLRLLLPRLYTGAS
ncbi:hypothetical protein Sjap_026163 [Stephania japonica]|uniref:Uncharacterized protein n=1 Tax=Stephania japonica TaxID=461633 RepID=A0AAP0HI88_9MAGN